MDSPADDEMDAGAHGEFDDVAKPRSLALWAVTHKPVIATVLAGVAAAAALRTARHPTG